MESSQEFKRPFFSELENLFSEYVEYYGGKIIDKLESNKVDRLNADFIFEQPEIVAELKIFEKDVFSEPEDLLRLTDLFRKWIELELITGEELREYVFRGKPLPQECIDDMIEKASKTIERIIYKANKQILESKKTFSKPNANGMIILINDGNYFFTNEGFLAAISNVISRKFKQSNFDVIVYLTINQASYKSDSNLDYNFWIPIYTKVDEHGETIVNNNLHTFVNDFGEKFFTEFMTLKTGHKHKEFIQSENLDGIKNHDFIPKEIIYRK